MDEGKAARRRGSNVGRAWLQPAVRLVAAGGTAVIAEERKEGVIVD